MTKGGSMSRVQEQIDWCRNNGGGVGKDLADTLESMQARIQKLEGELRIKSEFLSSRQCPDHSGKWPRGRCLQCEIEELEADK